MRLEGSNGAVQVNLVDHRFIAPVMAGMAFMRRQTRASPTAMTLSAVELKLITDGAEYRDIVRYSLNGEDVDDPLKVLAWLFAIMRIEVID